MGPGCAPINREAICVLSPVIDPRLIHSGQDNINNHTDSDPGPCPDHTQDSAFMNVSVSSQKYFQSLSLKHFKIPPTQEYSL